MADGAGAGGGGPFDPIPLGGNGDLGDVALHFLDHPGVDTTIPAPAPAPASASAAALHGSNQRNTGSRVSSGDDLLDWAATLDTYLPIGEDAAPVIAGPHGGLPIHGGSSASASSPAGPQEDVLDCSGCQILREIVHSNGFEATRLYIHGGPGVFYHAWFGVYRPNSEGLEILVHHSHVDFRSRDYEWVKHYLRSYALQRATTNFALMNDSLSMFHDVLCTDMNCSGIVGDAHIVAAAAAAEAEARNGGGQLVVDDADAFRPSIEGYVVHAESEPSQPSHAVVDVQRPCQPVVRTALAIQRERTAKLQLQDIARYFHLPMAEAAAKLSICSTALKAACRKNKVLRWPHRKLKSIESKVAKLRRSNNFAARKEIERLNASRLRILAGHV